MSRLFEYIALYHPPSKYQQNGERIPQKSVLVVPQTAVLAENEKEVGMLVARALPTEHLDHLDRVEIVVRPF